MLPSKMIGKQKSNAGSEKEITATTRTNNAARDTSEGKGNNIAESIDFQDVLISLLISKPKGLSLKALKKAVLNAVPSSADMIVPMVREIAIYESPGRYVLLPEIGVERLKKLQSESESCSRSDSESGSGNDSDSESNNRSSSSGSDSGTSSNRDSESNNRSGSSGSDSGTSSNSEGPDEYVDIMTIDDECESKHKTEASDQRLSSFIPAKSPDGRYFQNESNENQDNYESDTAAEIEKILLEELEVEMVPTPAIVFNESGKTAENMPLSPDNEPIQMSQNDIAHDCTFSPEDTFKKQAFPGKSTADLPHTRKRSFDQTLLGMSSNPLEKSDKRGKISRKHSEKDFRCGSNGGKQSPSTDSHYQKQGEKVGKSKEGPQGTHVGSSSMDNNKIGHDKSSGIEETHFAMQFGQNNEKNSDDQLEDSSRSPARVMQSRSQHLEAVNMEIGSQNELEDLNGRFRSNESSANADKQHDTTLGIVSFPGKESERQAPTSLEDIAERGKDSVFADKNNHGQMGKESAWYKDSCFCYYLKYEKDEPEFKGPIKTHSQYKEYMQECRDKHDSYLSLNKILDDYQSEFYNMANDLGSAHDCQDMHEYYYILGQLKVSERLCEEKRERLKKIRDVLRKELEHITQMIRAFVRTTEPPSRKG